MAAYCAAFGGLGLQPAARCTVHLAGGVCVPSATSDVMIRKQVEDRIREAPRGDRAVVVENVDGGLLITFFGCARRLFFDLHFVLSRPERFQSG